MAKDKECKKCGRTSNVVNISQDCPFCSPKNEEVKNQCDGCMRNLPIQNGAHFSESGHIDSYCTRDRYSKVEASKKCGCPNNQICIKCAEIVLTTSPLNQAPEENVYDIGKDTQGKVNGVGKREIIAPESKCRMCGKKDCWNIGNIGVGTTSPCVTLDVTSVPESKECWEDKLQLIYCEKCGEFINENIKQILKDFIESLISKARSEGYGKGQKEARAHYYEKVAREARSEAQREVVEKIEEVMPDLGIMAACGMSSEANHYVNGFLKAKEQIIKFLTSSK